MNLAAISGLGPYTAKTEETRALYYPENIDKVFLVEHPHTIELRTDRKLGRLLQEKYESVMESRYFGKNGIEIVLSNQLTQDEIEDLVRLSYNLTSSENRESL